MKLFTDNRFVVGAFMLLCVLNAYAIMRGWY